ncbi:restriction endonuclease subunit S [Selenomonas montiformis]|uniref:restriction endonuclease subunit S n=1 Tax=Selenomonas montiformis TaxID=2652285 RepID=UPI0039F4D95E
MMKYNFGDVFEDVTKKGTKIPRMEYLAEGKYPVIDQGKEFIGGYTDNYDGIFNDVPAIIFGDHTRILKYVDTPFFIGADGVKILAPKLAGANCKYLYYALQKVYVPDTGYNRHFKWLKEADIVVHDVNKQNEIVGQLDLLTSMMNKHQLLLDRYDELVKSRFIEMFGDPVTNPMKWQVKSLSELGDCKNGMNFHKGESGVDIHCLGVGDFQNLSVITDTSVLPIVSLNENPSEEYMLQDGDIVFVRSNGNKNLVGRCLTIYPHDIPTTFSGFCIRYRISSTDKVLTEYLLQVLKHDSMRQKMTGRGANIQNLNQQILSALQIPLPSIGLQRKFIEFVELADKSKLTIQKSMDNLQELRDSLLQEYFG